MSKNLIYIIFGWIVEKKREEDKVMLYLFTTFKLLSNKGAIRTKMTFIVLRIQTNNLIRKRTKLHFHFYVFI